MRVMLYVFIVLSISAQAKDRFELNIYDYGNSGEISLDGLNRASETDQNKTYEEGKKPMKAARDFIEDISRPSPYSHCYSLTGIDQAECKNNVDRDSGSGNISISNCSSFKLFSDNYYFCLSDVDLKNNNLESALRRCENMKGLYSYLYYYCKSKVEASRNDFNLANQHCRSINISVSKELVKDCFNFIKLTKENMSNKQQEKNNQKRLLHEQEKENKELVMLVASAISFEQDHNQKINKLNNSIASLKDGLEELNNALETNQINKEDYNSLYKEVKHEIIVQKTLKDEALDALSILIKNRKELE
jgi:hypothetical protein